MASRFNVVYSGELRSEIRAQQAVTGFAARFKLSEEQSRRLVLGGKAHVLKRDVDAETAETYRKALEAIGLITRLEPVPPKRPTDLELLPQGNRSIETAADEAEPSASISLGKPPSAPPPTAQPSAPTTSGRGPGDPARGAPRGPYARPITAGWDWIAGGFEHFKKDPWPWIGAVVILYIITIAISLVPLVGMIASTIVGPMLTGGLMIGASAQRNGESLRIEHLFAGVLSNQAGQLALIGVIYLVGGLFISLLVGLWIGGSLAVTATGLAPGTLNDPSSELVFSLLGPRLLLPILVALLLAIPLGMALFLAPPLVALDGLTAVAAMKLSFSGCLRNILPLLLYGLIAAALLFVGTIPLMLGLLVVLPVLMASLYAAYRDIYFPRSPR
jgi:uncharacterized membrane protein